MSLKAFHVFFVAICMALGIGVGVWALREQQLGSPNSAPFLIWLGFGGAGLMAVYGLYFLMHTRKVSYL